MKAHTKKLDFSYLLTSNLVLLTFIGLGCLLIAALAAILPRLSYANCSSRLKSLRLVLFSALFTDYKQSPRIHLRLLLLFFGLFLFLNINFISGNVKTDNVTVSTDEIVDSTSRLAATSKTLVVDAQRLDLIKKTPKGSFLEKLSEKKYFRFKGLHVLNRMKQQTNFKTAARKVTSEKD